MKLSYIRLLTENFDESFEFFGDKLGFEVTWGKKGDDYASFKASDSTMISIYTKKLMFDYIGGMPKSDISCHQVVVCLEVDSVDETYKALQNKNIKFVNEPKDMPGWGSRCFHILSPDEHLIEINEILPKNAWTDDLKQRDPKK